MSWQWKTETRSGVSTKIHVATDEVAYPDARIAMSYEDNGWRIFAKDNRITFDLHTYTWTGREFCAARDQAIRIYVERRNASLAFRSARHRLGMTQAQLGAALGYSKTSIHLKEVGKIPVSTVDALALQTLESREQG